MSLPRRLLCLVKKNPAGSDGGTPVGPHFRLSFELLGVEVDLRDIVPGGQFDVCGESLPVSDVPLDPLHAVRFGDVPHVEDEAARNGIVLHDQLGEAVVRSEDAETDEIGVDGEAGRLDHAVVLV